MTKPLFGYDLGYGEWKQHMCGAKKYGSRKKGKKMDHMEHYEGWYVTNGYGNSVTPSNVDWYGGQGYGTGQTYTVSCNCNVIVPNWYAWPTDGSGMSYQVVFDNSGGISVGSVIFTTGQNQVIQYPETDEQRVAREAQAAAWQANQDAAAKRAEELLLLHLSDEQCRQYAEHGYFETTVDDRVYRINKGRAMNVELMEGDKPKFKYCALPKDYAPAEDVMLAQLLMLQTDEAKFLATANRTVLHASP